MIKITPYLKYPLAGLALTGALFYPTKSHAQLKITTTVIKTNGRSETAYYSPSNTEKYEAKDIFVKESTESSKIKNVVTPKGTSDPEILSKAPSPKIKIQGKWKTAKIVVDLSENILYHYDDIGNALKAYKIASGRRTGKEPTPTHTGVRSVSHIEYYDYKRAPRTTKRYWNPNAYGPRIIILDKLDQNTGETSRCGEFIHGNNNEKTLGQYVSGGCMRMDNEVIKYLAPQMKRGDIVVIKANKKQQF